MARAKRKNRNGAGSPARLNKDGRYEALIVVALRTGVRQDELAALMWQDVDLEGPRSAITVRHSADTRISPPQITPTKTGKDCRIRIGPCTVEVLKAHHAR